RGKRRHDLVEEAFHRRDVHKKHFRVRRKLFADFVLGFPSRVVREGDVGNVNIRRRTPDAVKGPCRRKAVDAVFVVDDDQVSFVWRGHVAEPLYFHSYTAVPLKSMCCTSARDSSGILVETALTYHMSNI